MHLSDCIANLSKASEKATVTELEAKLVTAKRVKDISLCKLLVEAVQKQKQFDEALEQNLFDAVERLDAEVCAVYIAQPDLPSSYASLALDG